MKYLFFVLAMLLFSCGEDQDQAPTDTVQVITDPGRVNNDLQYKKDSVHIPASSEQEETLIQITKTEWAGNNISTLLMSKKVDSLVEEKNKALQEGKFTFDGNELDAIGKKEIGKLSAKELLYYCLAYPAYYAQSCSGFDLPNDGNTYFIPYLPAPENARLVSELQREAVQQKKAAVSQVLIKDLQQQTKIDLAYLEFIYYTELFDLIPLLGKKANFETNPLVYSLLIIMMEEHQYKPFLESEWYTVLSQQERGPRGEMPASQKDAEKLVGWAMKFYHQQTGTK